MATEPVYKDIDLSFKKHPLTGDIATVSDEEAIKSSLRNLLRFGRYDKPFRVGLESPLQTYLFDPIDRATATLMEVKLLIFIPEYEPRIRNLSVDITPQPFDNRYDIELRFTTVKSQNEETLQLFLPIERLK